MRIKSEFVVANRTLSFLNRLLAGPYIVPRTQSGPLILSEEITLLSLTLFTLALLSK
jgi:hypothetical protein